MWAGAPLPFPRSYSVDNICFILLLPWICHCNHCWCLKNSINHWYMYTYCMYISYHGSFSITIAENQNEFQICKREAEGWRNRRKWSTIWVSRIFPIWARTMFMNNGTIVKRSQYWYAFFKLSVRHTKKGVTDLAKLTSRWLGFNTPCFGV